jgi:hypothetical protein
VGAAPLQRAPAIEIHARHHLQHLAGVGVGNPARWGRAAANEGRQLQVHVGGQASRWQCQSASCTGTPSSRPPPCPPTQPPACPTCTQAPSRRPFLPPQASHTAGLLAPECSPQALGRAPPAWRGSPPPAGRKCEAGEAGRRGRRCLVRLTGNGSRRLPEGGCTHHSAACST